MHYFATVLAQLYDHPKCSLCCKVFLRFKTSVYTFSRLYPQSSFKPVEVNLLSDHISLFNVVLTKEKITKTEALMTSAISHFLTEALFLHHKRLQSLFGFQHKKFISEKKTFEMFCASF